MIISHKYKFVFIKTRKTAGTSFEIALGDLCGDEDVITRISLKDEKERRKKYRGAQNYRLPFSKYDSKDWKKLLIEGRFKRFENHDSAEKIVSLIGETQWNEYFKFCFERNPWDKMVSHYFWKKQQYELSDFAEYWKRGLNGEIIGFDETLKAMEQYSLDGAIAVDKVYKFEELEESLADLTARLNLTEPLKMPDYKAKGGHRSDKAHYREILNKEEEEAIRDLCSQEVEMLNYNF